MEVNLEIQPGVVIRLPDVIRSVIALLPDNKLVTDVGEVRPCGEATVIRGELIGKIIISPSTVRTLTEQGNLAPSLEELNVGDGVLLFDGHYCTITVVAVIDRPRRMVYSKDGEIIHLDSPLVAKNGWHTDETDLLTDQGWAVLWSLY